MRMGMALSTASRYWAVQSGLLLGHNAVPFVILAGPRSGSTLLQTTIDQHVGIQCMHELAREELRPPNFSRYFLGKRHFLAGLRKQDPREFLKAIFGTRQPMSVEAVGFKALYTQPSAKSRN